MSELNQAPHIPEGFSMGEAIASHDGVVCYPAMQNGSDDKYIVKNISVPASGVQLAALQLTGACATREDALAYYKDRAQEILQEARILSDLSKLEGFVPYCSTELTPKPEGDGFDVTLVAPYRLSLEQIFQEQIMTHQGIIDLAMDLCSALAACRRAGYMYIDLKPSNIFYTEDLEYRIGDLGFAALSSLRFASLPDKYHGVYTAPEIVDAFSQLNLTMDVYALGLILYQAYNGGTLPMDGGAPAQPLMPPVYADYEMAEIILTACHPDQSKRWADPTLLGQALVQYMQRNGVQEGPIIPPPVTTPELDVGEEFLPEEAVSDQEDWSSIPELAFMQELVDDDTTPSPETAPDISAAELDEETSQILAMADELIAHELPDPVVQPEAPALVIPEPIVISEPEIQAPEEEDAPASEAPQAASEQTAAQEPETPAVMDAAEAGPAEPAAPEQPPVESTPAPETAPEEKIPNPRRKRIVKLIVSVVVILLLAALIFTGYRHYQQTYFKTVDELVVTGTVDTITVTIRTDADPALLKVTCSDTYGNSLTGQFVDGKAVFTGLTPQTRYTIRVSIAAGYQLSGTVSDSFTTASQTKVEDLTIGIGPADGSAFLCFQVSGVECDEWILTWSAPGLEAQSTSFAGHSVTVYDLMIGCEYTFLLSAGDGSNVVGQTEVTYTAQAVIRAQDPVISACGDGILTVVWALPDGADAVEWTVRCYNEAGYDETITTSDCTCTFEITDHDVPYTVEICAVGMTQGVTVSIGADPINITNFTFELDDSGALLFRFAFTGSAPESGWHVCWSCDGSAMQTLDVEEAQVSLPFIPGGDYTVSLTPVDGRAIFGHSHSFSVPQAENFTGYGISLNNLQFMMCATPGTDDWTWDQIVQDAYKTTFLTGEQAGFVVWCDTEMEMAEENVQIQFVLQDADGKLLDHASVSVLWSELWHQSFCELTLPNMPEAPGNYCLWIYFDGMFVFMQAFTVE